MDFTERDFLHSYREENEDGSYSINFLIEENCTCTMPEGGECISPYLTDPDSNCEYCEGTGKVFYRKKVEYPPLDYSEIPF